VDPEDEIFDVEPIDVTPLEGPEPRTKPIRVEPTRKEKDEALAKDAPPKGIDPDELMHRIMEELDIPEDEEEMEEGPVEGESPEQEEAPKEKEAKETPEERTSEEEEAKEAPEEKTSEEEVEGGTSGKEVSKGDTSPPHVVKKAVVKRKPKGDE
jgi:hypothetical protein